MERNFVIHKNKTFWGKVWHIITSDGKGHIRVQHDNEEPDYAHISSLSVIPEVRRKGLATELLKKAEEVSGVNVFRLSVEKVAPKWILEFYERKGYEIYLEDDDYYYLEKDESR
jgi:ribosomal protein S18 acetylase RimI-like enzyme